MSSLNKQFTPVDRRKNLSLEEFKRDYLGARKPVVIEDATETWPARSQWTFDKFKANFGDTCVKIYKYDPEMEFTPDQFSEVPLAEYIDGITHNELADYPYYLRDNWQIFHLHRQLMQEHQVPAYFSDWFRFLPKFMRMPYPRIFLGPKGAITPLHVDVWDTHAWLSQLVGAKHWVLFPPDQAQYLHNYKVRVENPDLDKHPLYAKAKGYECAIRPGDTIYVPSRWSHWVRSLEAGISITYNFMAPGCVSSCLWNTTKDVTTRALRKLKLAA